VTFDVAYEINSEYPVFSYTANKLSPTEVAQTFVPPEAFTTLRDARNAILVGPRGSGKTTLLKMLTSEGLDAWQHDDAVTARTRVQDVGVFIGVDAMWREQIATAPAPVNRTFQSAAYALHIGRAFAQTMLFRLGRADGAGRPGKHLAVELSKSDEAEIAARAASLFKLSRLTPSLLSLDYELGDRLTELGTYRYRVPDGQQFPEWAYLNPLQSVAELAAMVNRATGQPSRNWAMLFDELELAPDAVVEDILRRLRGNEAILVFKLSLAPILQSTDALIGERGATHGQDVEYIPLTRADRSDAFAAEIFDKQRSIAGLPPTLNPQEALGESYFDAGDRGGRRRTRLDPYRKSGRTWTAMRWLEQNDETFARYLIAGNIDLNELESLSAHSRAAKIRKIRNLAIVRAHFLRGARLDTQSTRELYAGEYTLLAFPDGNPRMTTILMRDLLSSVLTSRDLPLSRAAQAEAIAGTSTRFMGLLHAQAGIRVGTRAITMVNLLDSIGSALHDRVVHAPFSADVPAGFFVDEAFPAHFLPLLKQAVNTGAIIHLPRENTTLPVSTSARGRHYRLSYLLAPRYGLPIRQGKTVSLTNLLQSTIPVSGQRFSEQPALLEIEVPDE
jgi:hypothetical protein